MARDFGFPGGPGPQDGKVPVVAGYGMRALIVDEALPVRRKLTQLLIQSGLRAEDVVAVASAEEAVEIAADLKPSVVFAEFVGDTLTDGLDMILALLDEDPDLRVVVTTAEDGRSELVREAVRAGAFAVIAKPLRVNAVRSVLADIETETGGIERLR